MTTSPKPTKDEALKLALAVLEKGDLLCELAAASILREALAQPAADDKAICVQRIELTPKQQKMLSVTTDVHITGVADDKPLTTNSVVDQKGANVDDKAGGEPARRLHDAAEKLVDAYRKRYSKPSNDGLRRNAPLYQEVAELNAALREAITRHQPQAVQPAERVALTDERKDYLRRLIAGVRRMIDKDPETINAREEFGEECITGKWIDASLLCLVVEKDILHLPGHSITAKDQS